MSFQKKLILYELVAQYHAAITIMFGDITYKVRKKTTWSIFKK